MHESLVAHQRRSGAPHRGPLSEAWRTRFAKRRETGKEQRVQVSYDEGVAIHIGPESCAVAREGFGEALTGGA